jgi:hypothetical protein
MKLKPASPSMRAISAWRSMPAARLSFSAQIVRVADHEEILGPFAERRDPRIVHAQVLVAQHLRNVGEQTRAVARDERHPGQRAGNVENSTRGAIAK